MKQVLFVAMMVLTLNSFSQKGSGKIILVKGQKFIVKDTITQETDMGMGMSMKNNTTSKYKFAILDVNDKNYIATKTLTDLKMAMDMMGQQVNYDSDKKEDSASEIGKSIQNLNLPDTFTLDKNTGAVTVNKKNIIDKKNDSNPLENMFESMGSISESNSSDPFLIIPAGIKAGGSWVDSASNADNKWMKKYTLTSIDKNLATIKMEGNVQSNVKTDMQGMQVSISISTKTTGEIIIDSKTSLVNRKNTISDISGTLEMMGQSMPVTGKGTTTSVYEY
ncbi:MAG: DUF6263 family protein [Ferruginibacter sp.]